MTNNYIQMAENMDVIDFISKLEIIGKDGSKCRLQPTEEQLQIIEALQSDDDLAILKPRQIGSSTIIVAYLFALAYQSKEPITFAILSYKLSSSKHLLNIAKIMYNFLPSPLKKDLAVNNSTELAFTNGGRILAVASTQKGGLRSFTASKIMISEYAFAEQPEELKATAIAALNNGQLILESTANYYNDCFHKEITRCMLGEAHYQYLFFRWCDHQEYRIEEGQETISNTLTDEEKALMELYDIDLAQLAWRREKISKLGWEKFIREYPISIEEAYRISGSTYFRIDDFKDLDVVTIDGGEWTTLSKPVEGHSYAIGVDTSGGVGRDYSVVFVVSKNTGNPVCIYRSNKTSPIALAEYVIALSEQYNNALILIEANNYGLATINEVAHQTGRLWKDTSGKDFLTTSKSKPLLFENLKKELQNGYITQMDNVTALELRSILVDEKGIIKFSDLLDSHSDSAMACALAYWCLRDVKIREEMYLPSWIINKKVNKQRTVHSSARRY
jgi:hypothetical protein